MSIVDNSPVNAANTNAGFLSRKTNSDTVAIISLNNTDPTSGPSIANLQEIVNGARVITSIPTSYNAGEQITLFDLIGRQIFPVQSTGGDVTLSTEPFGTTRNWAFNCEVIIEGLSDTNTITLQYSDTDYGILLNGNCTLRNAETITLYWSELRLRWLEKCRNS